MNNSNDSIRRHLGQEMLSSGKPLSAVFLFHVSVTSMRSFVFNASRFCVAWFWQIGTVVWTSTWPAYEPDSVFFFSVFCSLPIAMVIIPQDEIMVSGPNSSAFVFVQAGAGV